MVKGTIYHDTSSKGWKNGKQVFKDCWRAEITIDGKRYRFRSKSCKECEQWLKEKRQTIPASFCEIINFPDYYMDRSNGRVYHRYGGMLRRLRTYGKPHHPDYLYVNLRAGGKSYSLGYNRLRLAVDLNISYFRIPEDVIVKEGGQLSDYSEHMRRNMECFREKRACTRMQSIDTAMRELRIIKRAYNNQSHVEVVKYIEAHRTSIIRGYVRAYHISTVKAELCYNLAMESMVDIIDNPRSCITRIMSNMKSQMRSAHIRLNKEQGQGGH